MVVIHVQRSARRFPTAYLALSVLLGQHRQVFGLVNAVPFQKILVAL